MDVAWSAPQGAPLRSLLLLLSSSLSVVVAAAVARYPLFLGYSPSFASSLGVLLHRCWLAVGLEMSVHLLQLSVPNVYF